MTGAPGPYAVRICQDVACREAKTLGTEADIWCQHQNMDARCSKSWTTMTPFSNSSPLGVVRGQHMGAPFGGDEGSHDDDGRSADHGQCRSSSTCTAQRSVYIRALYTKKCLGVRKSKATQAYERKASVVVDEQMKSRRSADLQEVTT